METICLVNKPFSPFLTMEHQQHQPLATTTSKQHHYDHFQQEQQQEQYSRLSPQNAATCTTTATEYADSNGNNSPMENSVEQNVSMKLVSNAQGSENLERSESARKSPKRPWSDISSFGESRVKQPINEEHFSGKRWCPDFPRKFSHDRDVEQTRFWMNTKDNGWSANIRSDSAELRTNCIKGESDITKEEQRSLTTSHKSETLTQSSSEERTQNRSDEDTQEQCQEENNDKIKDENSNLDSSPATPSSGFIDIESDTPPASPLNLTTPTVIDAPISENNINIKQVGSHHDSALGHEIEDHQSNTFQTECHMHSIRPSPIKGENPTVDPKSPQGNKAMNIGESTKEEQQVSSPPSSQANSSELHEASRTNFSIDAILSPRFGSTTTTCAAGCVSPRQSSVVENFKLYPNKNTTDSDDSKPAAHEEPTRSVPTMRNSPSAFTPVDLRTGTRSNSLSSPSPSSRSSALSSPVSGSPSPSLSSFPMSLPIPAFYNKDLFSSSESLPEKTKDQSVCPQSLQDPRKLLSELYELHQSQTDSERREKPNPKLESSRVPFHTTDREKGDFLYFPKFLPGPGRELETFLSRHLPFLSHPTLGHPAVLPFIYPPHHQYHHHLHHHQQQNHHHHQQKQQHPTLSPNSAQSPKVSAPPLLDPTRPHVDPLRLLQQGQHPPFPQTPSSLPSHPMSPKCDTRSSLRNEHIHRIRNMGKAHADVKDSHLVTNTEKSLRVFTDTKTAHAVSDKKDTLTHSHIPPMPSNLTNPLHQIINQFDPEKLFSAKDGILSSPKSSSELTENTRNHRVNHLEKQSYKHELHKISTPKSKTNSDIPRNQNKQSIEVEGKKVLPSPTRPNTNTNRDTDKRPKQESQACAKGNNSSKTDNEAEGKGEKGENPLWPAWVFCTRYSDRPSSGPRSRKPKRSKTQDEKRPRTAFTNDQLQRLKREFEDCRYLTETRRKSLADQLGLTESQIKIWFQNKRAKIKKSVGACNPLAMQLMEQGLYNHTTVKTDE